MHAAEKAGKSGVATDKALESISESSSKMLEETIMTKEVPKNDEMKLVDVTHTMFEKYEKKQFPESKFRVYKGIIANLISWGRNDFDGKLCGVLAGDGTTVTDVIVSTDFEKCMASDVVHNRWEDLEVKPMGMAVWSRKPQPSVDHLIPSLRDLKSTFETQLLIVMSGGQDPAMWDIHLPKAGPVTCCQCSSAARSGKKKDDKYRVVDFNALGHTTMSSMSATVSMLIQNSLKKKLATKLKSNSVETSSLRQHCVPADGLCFWHCVLGYNHFESWYAVPRKESGYALNSRHVKNEEDMARQLMNEVMDRAVDNGVDSTMVEDIRKTGSIYVDDLPWVCKALNLNVRCTISDEA